jgi:hypothetical protein
MRDTCIWGHFGGWCIGCKDNRKVKFSNVRSAITDSTEQARGILGCEDRMFVNLDNVGAMIFAAPILDFTRSGVLLNVDNESPGASSADPNKNPREGLSHLTLRERVIISVNGEDI